MNKPFHHKPAQDTSEMIFGIFPILEALRSAADVDKVILQTGLRSPQLQELRALLEELEIPLQMVPREKLDRMTRANHQGVIGFISPVTFQPIEEVLQRVYELGRDPFLLILDRVTDVRNFGAICRSAECFGVKGIIVPEVGAAQINEDALKDFLIKMRKEIPKYYMCDFSIIHQRPNGTDKTIEIDIHSSETIASLKDKIFTKEGIAKERQKLFPGAFADKRPQLENDRSIASYGFKRGILRLVVE
jgi:hypothetical protein